MSPTRRDPLAETRAQRHVDEANAAHLDGRHADAEAAYRQALAIDPNAFAAHHGLGVLLLQLGRVDEGQSELEAAAAIDADNPLVWNDLGESWRLRDAPEPAAEAYGRAIGLNPAFCEAYNNFGVLRARQGRLDEAEELLRKALSLYADYAQAHNNLGVVLAGQGRLQDALLAYEQAVKIDPGYRDALDNYVELLDRGGELLANTRRLIEELRARLDQEGDD